MTLQEKVRQSINYDNEKASEIEKLITMAYEMGRTEATRNICDQHAKIIDSAKDKAKKMRYHHMAMSILPQSSLIYNSSYAGDWIATFGDDKI